MQPELSVILPVFNEIETLLALKSRLIPILEQVSSGSFEVIFVDDGSWDGSGDTLEPIGKLKTEVKVA